MTFAAWTDAWQLAEWFGSDDFSTTTEMFDFRADGVWALVMHGPDGTADYPNWVQWQEIIRPSRVVYRQRGRTSDPEVFVTTVVFAAPRQNSSAFSPPPFRRNPLTVLRLRARNQGFSKCIQRFGCGDTSERRGGVFSDERLGIAERSGQ